MPDLASRRASFRSLHESGCFVIPNPWDPGTASALASLGFQALATTSAGFAHSRALPDSPQALDVEDVLAHVAEIVEATELPVNADFQAGYADDAEGVAANVGRCVEAGVSGLSIEDATGTPADRPLFELPEAVERVSAAREAIDASGADVLLTARAECFLVGAPDPLEESIRRLAAYAEAGADVLYAPGPHEREPIAAIVEAVAPKPVNVLIAADVGLRVSDLAELGVRRISVGSALSRVAWGAFMQAAEELAEQGSFGRLSGGPPPPDLNALFERRP
jgi:2-methylisocitrate lyase-like PEP mutase family enzyme